MGDPHHPYIYTLRAADIEVRTMRRRMDVEDQEFEYDTSCCVIQNARESSSFPSFPQLSSTSRLLVKHNGSLRGPLDPPFCSLIGTRHPSRAVQGPNDMTDFGIHQRQRDLA